MAITINPRFKFGQLVFLRVNTDHAVIVTGYVIRKDNNFVYLVSGESNEEQVRSDDELSDEKVL